MALVNRRSFSRRLRDELRNWLVAPINDDLRMVRKILMEILANTREVKTKMTTKQQLEAFVDELGQKVEKVGNDIVAHVGELREQIAAGQDLSSTLEKLEGLGTKLQAVDDFIPERPTPEPQPEAPEPGGDTAPLPGGGES